METYLVSKGFLYRQSSKGEKIMLKILHDHTPSLKKVETPKVEDVKTVAPSIIKELPDEFKMIEQLKIEASLHESVCKEIKTIKDSITTLQEQLASKEAEAAKTIKAKEKLNQICSILGI